MAYHRRPSSQVAQCWRIRLPLQEMQETQVWSLDREDPLEKEMATHSSILAWRIPWTEERGGLQSMGSQRVRQDWATSLSFFPVFLPGEFYGQRRLVGYIVHGVAKSRTQLNVQHTHTYTHTHTHTHGPTLSCNEQDLVPWSRIKSGPLHWEGGVLATGSPGKSSNLQLIYSR